MDSQVLSWIANDHPQRLSALSHYATPMSSMDSVPLLAPHVDIETQMYPRESNASLAKPSNMIYTKSSSSSTTLYPSTQAIPNEQSCFRISEAIHENFPCSRVEEMKSGILREDPLYKTELCRQWESSNGKCPYGSRCRFAHGPEELRAAPRPTGYKSKLCKFFLRDGFCPFGRRCYFRHCTSTELGTNPNLSIGCNVHPSDLSILSPLCTNASLHQRRIRDFVGPNVNIRFHRLNVLERIAPTHELQAPLGNSEIMYIDRVENLPSPRTQPGNCLHIDAWLDEVLSNPIEQRFPRPHISVLSHLLKAKLDSARALHSEYPYQSMIIHDELHGSANSPLVLSEGDEDSQHTSLTPEDDESSGCHSISSCVWYSPVPLEMTSLSKKR